VCFPVQNAPTNALLQFNIVPALKKKQTVVVDVEIRDSLGRVYRLKKLQFPHA
jgi:hypothetical protein